MTEFDLFGFLQTSSVDALRTSRKGRLPTLYWLAVFGRCVHVS
jgi:hypothetical protein